MCDYVHSIHPPVQRFQTRCTTKAFGTAYCRPKRFDGAMSPVVSQRFYGHRKEDEMAAKEYRVTLPNGEVEVMMANSAEQAARRAERKYCTGHVVTQRGYVSDRLKRHRSTNKAS